MSESELKIKKISQFISDFMTDCQTKPMRYGTIEQLETAFYLLDLIYFMLNDLDNIRDNIGWYSFLRFKKFGPRSASMVIREKCPEEFHHAELIKLRNEYYEWRERQLVKG